MSSGFHRLGANAGKVIGWSNKRELMRSPLASVGQISIPVMDDPPLDLKTAIPGEFVDTFSPGVPEPQLDREVARSQGFTGDQCSNCNSMRMRVSGHCQCCDDCGTTTGCS